MQVLKLKDRIKQKGIYKGSLTVEASLVFPLFIYAIIALSYFFQIIYLQDKIQQGLSQVAKSASEYAYVYEIFMKDANKTKELPKEIDGVIETLADATFYEVMFLKNVDKDWFENSCIVGGIYGINFLKSTFLQDGETINVVAMYRIKIPIPFYKINSYTMVQRVSTRGFIGVSYPIITQDDSDEESAQDIVYITQTGTVYHVLRNCTHLKLSITKVMFSSVSGLRNNNGGKYYPCLECTKNKKVSNNEKVYITNEGEKYHINIGCSGLKRTVIEIKISEVGSRSSCKRCSKKED